MPLVSICTPCYNHEKYLSDYFESIIQQTYENIELIIADDCSDDSSPVIIENYLPRLKKRFKNVVFLKNKINMGIPKNCNQILDHVNGKYIKWLASDDMILNECIMVNVKYMEDNPVMALCHSRAYRVPDEYQFGNKYRRYPVFAANLYRPTIDIKRMSNFERMLYGNFIITPTIMVRRDIYRKYGSFDENFEYEDVEFFTRISLKEEIGYLNRTLTCYRESATSISNCNSAEQDKQKKNFRIKYMVKIKLLRKYLRYIEKVKREKIIDETYFFFFRLAIDNGLRKEANYMYQKLKVRKLKIPFELKKKYVLLLIFNQRESY
jgi:glycosyltransferase involved in cell wall biosynthesis